MTTNRERDGKTLASKDSRLANGEHFVKENENASCVGLVLTIISTATLPLPLELKGKGNNYLPCKEQHVGMCLLLRYPLCACLLFCTHCCLSSTMKEVKLNEAIGGVH